MGYLIKRSNQKGETRYTAMYRDIKGKPRSAGTYDSEKAAERAWQRGELRLAEGKVGDPRRGRQTLRRYVEEEWFPNHVIEETTREGYTYTLNRYILPELGSMRMVEIMPSHVREWITTLENVRSVKRPMLRQCKVVLDAVLTTAFNDQITFLHAGKGVKTPAVAKKKKRILTAEEFDRIHEALVDPVMRLLVETDIESGLRWGELTELRPKDIDLKTGVLTVSRVVVHLKARNRPDGVRFLVKDYPKDGEWRQLKLAEHLLRKVSTHITANALGPDDLLFWLPQPVGAQRRTRPERLPDPDTLGLTEPNEKGRRYRHGTMSAYTAARCRCQHCRDAMAAYRARRRAAGRDAPRRPRTVDTDGHISNDWFRRNVWHKTLETVGLSFHVTPHGLRHAHASWLLAGGADIQVVKERLGHGTITTTEKYLHTLPGTDDVALTALAAIRGLPDVGDEPSPAERQATAGGKAEPQLAEMMAMMAKMTKMYESMNEVKPA